MEFGFVYLKENGTQHMTEQTSDYLDALETRATDARQEELFWKNLDRLVEYQIEECENNYESYDVDLIYDFFLHNDDEEYYDESKGGSLYNPYTYASDSDYYSD